VVRNRRTGETFPVAQLVEKAIGAFLNEEARIRDREQANGGQRGESLADVVAEIEASREAGCDG